MASSSASTPASGPNPARMSDAAAIRHRGQFAGCTFSCMKKLIVTCIVLFGCVYAKGQERPEWVACQAYANLANTRDRSHLDNIYKPLKKSFVVRAIYAERLYAFKADQRDTILLDNLPRNGQELRDLYDSVDCAHNLLRPVTNIDAIAISFNAYFIDALRAVVRHPEYMQQFVRMFTQFNSTSDSNVELDEQLCPLGVYVYLHRRAQLLAALPIVKANPKYIPHKYNDCP